jgi:hypothetical protein
VNDCNTTGFAKSDKKTTITFAIDNRILKIIRDDADSHIISINAKINYILLLYSLCYRYSEAGGVIFPLAAMECH